MANSKDVVVTGVSTGIGWGTTKVLVSKGFRVFGSVRKPADADRLQREFGNGFVPLMMDITDADAVHQAAQKVGSDRHRHKRRSRYPGSMLIRTLTALCRASVRAVFTDAHRQERFCENRGGAQ
jgi:NAD(P)-dependent dehydrogenase (short-subunit alcohol dehydrogenase family)